MVSRERAGDVDGMAALYEDHAVLDCGDGQLQRGREAIRSKICGGALPATSISWEEMRLITKHFCVISANCMSFHSLFTMIHIKYY